MLLHLLIKFYTKKEQKRCYTNVSVLFKVAYVS